ncbi:MAG: hypothetical protein M3Y87_21520 [Myxococcota bacterium]|nr:hypothetical protein [Myxococcota bacterium]
MNRSALAALASLALSLVLAACSEAPLTQLVVVVDTDIEVPRGIDRVEIVVEEPGGQLQRSTGALAGDGAISLPVTLGVVHRGGELGPVTVTARGLRGADEIIVRDAQVFMIAGRTMVLELHLERACVGVACEAGAETCEHGGCRDVLIAASELRDHAGEPPRLLFDGGGGDCLAAELCNGIDDDCDTLIDEDFDLTSDARHCGSCTTACPDFGGSRPACVDSACTIACEEGFGDCDGEPRTGCETPLDSLTDCGTCGEQCSIDHGVPFCFASTCSIENCAPGWGDCNEGSSDGCEMRLDAVDHCGSCGSPCAPAHATPRCAGGACGYVACDAGWGDCDLMAITGCETPLDTVTSCGACTNPCPTAPPHATSACLDGRCAIGSCEAGWADCNAMAFDGCEARLDSLANCGACGVSCALAHAAETCATGSCRIASCDAGWGDCDTMASTGCEASLETSSRCGSCSNACVAPRPLCSATGGAASCESTCLATEVLCGADCVEIATSLDHCGGCDSRCAPANASGVCSSGACRIAACIPGWGDCNGSAGDGCETRLDSVTHCGACGNTCSLAGATEQCAGGTCAVLACEPMLDDCDGTAANGCETRLDTLSTCGACGTTCALANATETCSTGSCAIVACAAGWSDCDGMQANGCETRLDTLTTCGSCTGTCDLPRAGETCAGGSCALTTCDPDWGNCDGAVANGCEQSLRTRAHCGACGATCGPFPNATATCASGTCEQACNALWGDCDAAMPGCETSLESLTHCGGCGVICPMPTGTTTSCSGGTCHIETCTQPGRADCNGVVADGCEANIDNDAMSCGGCGVMCGPGQRCRGASCRDM